MHGKTNLDPRGVRSWFHTSINYSFPISWCEMFHMTLVYYVIIYIRVNTTAHVLYIRNTYNKHWNLWVTILVHFISTCKLVYNRICIININHYIIQMWKSMKTEIWNDQSLNQNINKCDQCQINNIINK